MAEYRRPFAEPGEARRPTLTWPRQIPIEGEPADVVGDRRRLRASGWRTSDVPKLFVNAEPGAILIGAQREFCRALAEPARGHGARAATSSRRTRRDEIGQALADWYRVSA